MEKDKKIELECDYCRVPITEKDHRCPNCGADCTDKIKKYKKQQEQVQEEELKKKEEYTKELVNDMVMPISNRIPIIFGTAVFIMIFIFGIFSHNIINHGFSNGNSSKGKNINYHSSVGYNEWGESADCNVQLDSYEYYSYVSDRFPEDYNTPEGYQKIAFHFQYENKRDRDELLTGFSVRLKADGYQVDMANLKVGSFERVEEGKEKYTSILNTYAGPSEKIQGYVGYVVPKDAKKLVFTFDGVTITMDNPVYQGE